MNCIIESRNTQNYTVTKNTYQSLTIYFQHSFSHILSFFMHPCSNGVFVEFEIDGSNIHSNNVQIGVGADTTLVSFYYRIGGKVAS